MLEDIHLAEVGDICFYHGKLLSVADDGVLKVFRIQSGAATGQPGLELETQLELPEGLGETNSIASNQMQTIALGGSNKTVDLFTLPNQDQRERGNVFFKGPELFGAENSFLAMKFNSKVKKVRYNGKWVLGFSEDEHVTIFNTENEKTFSCKPGHLGCCALSASIDPNGRFAATTGSDGFLNIYKIEKSESSATLLSKVKICEKNLKVDRTFDLDLHWIDSETIIVPGSRHLGCVTMADDDESTWELSCNEAIHHDKEMSSLFAISD